MKEGIPCIDYVDRFESVGILWMREIRLYTLWSTDQ